MRISMMLELRLANKRLLKWAQKTVTEFHYLHKPVDVRCSPVAYCIVYKGTAVGCLIFGRPEASRVNGWYGSLNGIREGKYRISRWEVLNLARVWLNPIIQQGGEWYIENAATRIIAEALERIVYDYLFLKPPVWMEQPYQIREVLSYCDTRIHSGTLYRAANFSLTRKNRYGIETYVRVIRRRLTHQQIRTIREQSNNNYRCERLRIAATEKVGETLFNKTEHLSLVSSR